MQKHWPPFNFSAGPAMLPKKVMQIAQQEFLDWHGTGLSVMDFSHRGKEFASIAEKAETDLRELMSIPDNYKVLFSAGGASLQFAMVPLNFLRTQAVYVNTGIWGKKAIGEASKFGNVSVVEALQSDDGLLSIVPEKQWAFSDTFDYFHLTTNETIGGVEFLNFPKHGKGRWIADMSSNILSKIINIEDFALIYAGAQKNIGPAGLSIIIVRDDWLQKELPPTVPSLMQYKVLAENDSMYNTPPTYSWYLAGLVFDWIKRQGGVEEMERRADERSTILYEYIDNSEFYRNPVKPHCRSRMNIPFILQDESLNEMFLAEAEQFGLVNLKGHRSVGGMRASLYNAMPIEGVEALVEFMKDFEKRA
ncbi:3-phosphoserine/phosphohydroxythreonine transaminase [Pleionea sediminis]|uniref:3-phosphoserine/phosphohydroxythreonine transaminase n=1 Tax=Pleionea sediminis TaxID=2569479 RepID=UPI001186B96B|nr:3-phosphoserine/phosphohydroxythreonine transaminase [Pleionea sediminis]